VDLESLNGIYRKLRHPTRLIDGDLLLLGQQVLRFEAVMDADPCPRPATQNGVTLFGTPQTARQARLCQQTFEGETRDVYHMGRREIVLGRESSDICFPDDAFLSRRHAAVSYDEDAGTYTVEDLGSSNGTFLLVRGRARLKNGDVLRIGFHLVRIELNPATEPTSSPGAAVPFSQRGGAA